MRLFALETLADGILLAGGKRWQYDQAFNRRANRTPGNRRHAKAVAETPSLIQSADADQRTLGLGRDHETGW